MSILTIIHNVTNISQVFSQFHETGDMRGQTATPETVHCGLIVVNVYHGLCLDAKVAQILCKSGTRKKGGGSDHANHSPCATTLISI